MALNNLTSLSDLVRIAKRVDDKKEILILKIDDVQSKEQVRKRFRNIEELAASLKSEGLQSPIIVSPKNSVGKYVIQKGERRWRAAKLAGFETIEALVNTKSQNRTQETIGELVENIQRDDLTAMEIAHALGKLIDAGYTQADIARSLGKSRAYVSMHVALLKLPECVLKLTENDIVGDADTLGTLRQIYELDPAHCVRFSEQIQEQGGATRNQVREELAKLRKKLEPDPEPDPNTTSGDESAAADVQEGVLSATQEHDDSGPQTGDTSESASDTIGEWDQPISPTSEPSAQQDHKQNPFKETDAPKASTEQAATTEPADAAQQSDEWVKVAADALVISVRVVDEDNQVKTGHLLTDRIAHESTLAWVQLDGQQEPVCVATATIQVQEIGTKHA